MEQKLDWNRLSLPDLWSQASTEADRGAAQRLIELTTRRVAPRVQQQLEEIQKQQQQTPGVVFKKPAIEQRATPSDLDSILSCRLQRWILTPIAASRAAAQTTQMPVQAPSAKQAGPQVSIGEILSRKLSSAYMNSVSLVAIEIEQGTSRDDDKSC
jgi:hypothetical protein